MLNRQGLEWLFSQIDFVPSTVLDQHFLIDESVARAIADDASSEAKKVLEIGAGWGAITELLAETGVEVIAYEKDRRCMPVLEAIANRYPNLTLRNLDAVHNKWDRADVFVSDLPFSILESIIQKIIAARFRKVVIVVGERLASHVNADYFTSSTTRLATLIKCHFRVESWGIDKSSFFPEPATNAVVLSMTPKKDDVDMIGKTLRLMFKNPERKVFEVLSSFELGGRRIRSRSLRNIRPQDVDPDYFNTDYKKRSGRIPERVRNVRIGSLTNSDLETILKTLGWSK